MKNKQNSLFKSRLRLSKSAFLQLVEVGLQQLNGLEATINDFFVHIKSIRQLSCAFQDGQIVQTIEADVNINKPQGWMPLAVSTNMQTKIVWQLTHQSGYPAIKIIDLAIESEGKSNAKVFNINFGVPDFIEKKILKEVYKKQPVIENLVNTRVAQLLKPALKNIYTVSLPNNLSCFVACKRLQWRNLLEQEFLIIDSKITTWLSWEEVERTPFVPYINFLAGDLEDTMSIVRLTLPYRNLADQLVGMALPVGKRGKAKIEQASFSAIDQDSIQFMLSLSGGVNADIEMTISIHVDQEAHVKIEAFDIEMRNKLLDFGAALFEKSIKNKIETQLNEQLNLMFSKGFNVLNEKLNSTEVYFEFQKKRILPEDVRINTIFLEREAVLILKSELLAEITIKKIPQEMLNKIKA